MENPSWHNIHPNFKFNGAPLVFGDLSELGYSLTKEGAPFETPLGEFLLDWASDTSTLEVNTSGSTGKPKKITLKKEQMVNSALATGAYFQLSPKQTALLCLPSTGIAGKMMLVRAMVLGLHLDVVEPSSTPLDNNGKDYDFVAMVPMQAKKSLDQLHRVNTLIVGGAPVDVTLKNQLGLLPTKVYETYGMTETITHIAVKEIAPEPQDYFETLPGISVTTDERGCLMINAPKISEEKVITNDLVELVTENRFKWLGRFDSIINSGGIKLVPEAIEEKLSTIIKTRFFVAGIPDETLGRQLVLVVEAKPETRGEDQLLNQIKALKTLSKYEVPKKVFVVNAFSETSTKKIDRSKTLASIIF
ncbi:O-succinylbenzoic acid--CoA ligase [Flagellimonas taeanensis]|uniref:AMP-binding protein n=1 Tax=Flavobacteriaceae TaxID=49546 RepID=UPI000E6904A7|nr:MULTISPECIES: AMP-binding protein [Allomuricauda]MDC6385637.1 AMP-binding protein [Muricauda sp. SK9]RIV51066.1 O-succinylbenzoic acid--CoA ligase [Allomuricauda taeanensis]